MAGVATSCGVQLACRAGGQDDIRSQSRSIKCESRSKADPSTSNAARFSRRNVAFSSAAILSASLLMQQPAAALLEADDDEELLEKTKEDRQKRIQKRGALSSLKNETASLQVAVYKLSQAGQALENDDFAAATNVLGNALDSEWVANIKSAFAKVSTSSEEQGEAELFTKSLSSLQSAVSNKDADSAKSAFVASATALEKWTSLTGLTEQIKGL